MHLGILVAAGSRPFVIPTFVGVGAAVDEDRQLEDQRVQPRDAVCDCDLPTRADRRGARREQPPEAGDPRDPPPAPRDWTGSGGRRSTPPQL